MLAFDWKGVVKDAEEGAVGSVRKNLSSLLLLGQGDARALRGEWLI